MNKVKCLIFALPLLLVWQSCTKESTPNYDAEIAPLQESKVTVIDSEMTPEDIAFLESKGVIPWTDDLVFDKGNSEAKSLMNDKCSCFYRVLEASVDPVPSQPTYTESKVKLMTDASCDEGFNCNYFEGRYCQNVIPCNDDWPFLPYCVSGSPYDPNCFLEYDFKCDVERHSQFAISAKGKRWTDCNNASGVGNTGTVRFKVFCVENDPICGGYGFSTQEIVYSLSSQGSASANFRLGQKDRSGNPITCGCKIELNN